MGIGHLLERAVAVAVPQQVIGQHDGERLVADDRTGTKYGVPEAARFGLRDEDRAHPVGQRPPDLLQQLVLAGSLEPILQLVGLVEIVADRVLVPIGDEDQRIAARLDRLVNRILDQGPVDDGQHLLGHRLGGRKKACAEAGNRKDGLADPLRHESLACRGGKATIVAPVSRAGDASMGANSGTASRSAVPIRSRS